MRSKNRVGWVEERNPTNHHNNYYKPMKYKRLKVPGSTYFFTLVTHNRKPILCEPENIILLRSSFKRTMEKHPFTIDAIVILPDHLHCIWTLPPKDADFSTRWRLIKSWFSRNCHHKYQGIISDSRKKKQEKAIWQRRFWEHLIKDKKDFINHLNYIHYNPVKHALVSSVKDWQYSSFHRYVQRGVYKSDWGNME